MLYELINSAVANGRPPPKLATMLPRSCFFPRRLVPVGVAFAFVLLALLLVRPGHAAAAEKIRTDGQTLLEQKDFDIAGKSGSGPDHEIRRLASGGPGGIAALRVTTHAGADKPWKAQLRATSRFPVAKGDTGLVQFYARATDTSHESGQATVRINLQNAAGHYPRILVAQFPVDRDWRLISAPFAFRQDHTAGDVILNLDFGYGKQAVDVAGLRLSNQGDTPMASLPRTRASYPGQAPDAPW